MTRSRDRTQTVASRRRALLALGLGASAVWPLGGYAQQRKKLPAVGVLHPGAPSARAPLIIALKQGLRDLGYVEGQTIALELRHAHQPEAAREAASELVKRNVDVIVAVAMPSIDAAKAATSRIPIVATDLQIDPIASGLAASLAKPGGNITGLFLDFPSITGKWLELLGEVIPGIKRVGVLWDASSGATQLDSLGALAKKLAIQLEVAKFQHANEIEPVLGKMLKREPQALLQLSSPVVNQASALVAKLTQANRLPAVSMFSAFPESGGLLSFGPDLPAYWGRVAPLVDKILKGTKPGVIPIERPTKFELIVNKRTATAIGINMPSTVLIRANRVIE